jgi:hypothetical protein
MISLKLDVSKIEKNRLFKGAKGTYLDATLIETPDGKYSDFIITQQVSKEERLSGVKGPIIGNGKYIGRGAPSSAPAGSAAASPDPIDDPDRVPF